MFTSGYFFRSLKRSRAIIISAVMLFGVTSSAGAEIVIDSISKITNFEFAYPSWSPDGNSIVLQSNLTGKWVLYTMNADGTNLTPITADQDYAVTPSWSPDGAKIVYVGAIDDELEDIWIVNPDGTGRTNLTNTETVNESHPHWSPDSKRIVFNSTREDPLPLDQIEAGYGEEVFEMGINGDNLARLTTWDLWDTFASISPDGKQIVWRRLIFADSSTGRRFDSEIFVMKRDGSESVNISRDPAFEGYPLWSPDGSKIIFVSNRSGLEQIYAMNADGSQVQRLVESDANDVRPCWSPDGTRIIFNRELNGSTEMLIIHLGESE